MARVRLSPTHAYDEHIWYEHKLHQRVNCAVVVLHHHASSYSCLYSGNIKGL